MATQLVVSTMTEMDQILKDVELFYGSCELPNYSKVTYVYERGLCPLLFDKLTDRFWIKDVTDLNSDAAFFVNLLSEKNRYLLIYSFVADYFHIIEFDKSDRFDSEPNYETARSLERLSPLVSFCLKHLPESAHYLSKEQLCLPIKFNFDGLGVRDTELYKILFLQDGELPFFACLS